MKKENDVSKRTNHFFVILIAFFKCQITFFVVLFFGYLLTVRDVNNLAIEAASYWIERDRYGRL